MTFHNAVKALTSENVEAACSCESEDLSALLSLQRKIEEELTTLEMEAQFLRHSALRTGTREVKNSGWIEYSINQSPSIDESLMPSAILRRCQLARTLTDSHTPHLMLSLARTAPDRTIELLDKLVKGIERKKTQLMEIEQKISTCFPGDLSSIRKLLDYISSALLAGETEVDLFAWMIADCAERISEIECEIIKSREVGTLPA